MTNYIEKNVLAAEINRLIKSPMLYKSENVETRISVLEHLLSFLDTLEVKKINDDKWFIKATEWLSANLHRYDEHIGLSVGEFVEKFRKAMGEPAAALLWHPADGDYLPEYEREVVVFKQEFPDDADIMRVTIAHRPNPDGWDGKSITTGEVEHYDVQTYDKGGWNIPDVKYWLDCELPKMEE